MFYCDVMFEVMGVFVFYLFYFFYLDFFVKCKFGLLVFIIGMFDCLGVFVWVFVFLVLVKNYDVMIEFYLVLDDVSFLFGEWWYWIRKG